MILVGMSLDKVAFLRFNVLIAEEISSLVTFLKEKTVFVCYVLFCTIYAWVIFIARNITFTRIIIKHIHQDSKQDSQLTIFRI